MRYTMLGSNEEERQHRIAKIDEGIPLLHIGEPIDVAYAALYLASDESKYLTGIELTMDSGMLSATPGK